MIREAIKQIATNRTENYTKVCKVVSVNRQNTTAIVSPVDGSANIEQVYLSIADGVLIIPKIDSLVAVSFLSEERAVMVSTSEIDKVRISIGSTQLEITDSGYLIGKDDIDLKTVLTDLINVITGIVVVQGKGPDVSKLQTLAQNIKILMV